MKLIEELKVNLEKAQNEEQKAKQDLEVVRLRAEETEQNIENEAKIAAAKAQLEVDEAKQAAAVSELKAMEEELEALKKEYASIVTERDRALKESEEAVAASKEAEKTVEDLATELTATKESVEPAQAAHLELERERARAAEVEDLKLKLEASSTVLHDLKAELVRYSKLKEQCVEVPTQELEDIKLKIEKTTSEVNCLKVASVTLKLQLEEKKSAVTMIREREEMACNAVSHLVDELNRARSEVALVQMKENKDREKMVELPKKLQEAAQEADRAKSLAEEARLDLCKANEEVELAKAKAREMESRLLAMQKEIEAVKASKESVVAEIKALKESESARSNNTEDSPSEVTLSVEEYDQLCKVAHDANETAKMRVQAVNSRIDMVKESELRSLKKLEEVNKELAERTKLLKDAKMRAEKAKEGKLDAEQGLRKWRADQEQQRKDMEGKINPKGFKASSEGKKGSKIMALPSEKKGTGSSSEIKTKKKKRSFIPRIITFFSKRKTHPAK